MHDTKYTDFTTATVFINTLTWIDLRPIPSAYCI